MTSLIQKLLMSNELPSEGPTAPTVEELIRILNLYALGIANDCEHAWSTPQMREEAQALRWLASSLHDMRKAQQALREIRDTFTVPTSLLLAMKQPVAPKELLAELQRVNRIIRGVIGDPPSRVPISERTDNG